MSSVHLAYNLERRPSSEFNHEAARDKLIQLDVARSHGPETAMIMAGDLDATDQPSNGDGAREIGRRRKLLRLSGWIDFESRVTVRFTDLLTS